MIKTTKWIVQSQLVVNIESLNFLRSILRFSTFYVQQHYGRPIDPVQAWFDFPFEFF